jgi:hypothetical protein
MMFDAIDCEEQRGQCHSKFNPNYPNFLSNDVVK